MNRPENGGRGPWHRAAGEVARGTIVSLYEHWALALFSLAAAFTIWFIIQDVENPKVQATFPPEGQPGNIEVAVRGADQAIPNRKYLVKVEIEGREDDLAALSPDQFKAFIDVKDLPVGVATDVPVRVEGPHGVRVLSVNPSTVSVTLEPLVEKEIAVTTNETGQLDAGFTVNDKKIEPISATIRGLQQELDQVVSVNLDVNLSALGEGETPIGGELHARSSSGNEVDVIIDPARGQVTYDLGQSFVQRSLSVRLVTSGQVAPGYQMGAVSIEPPILTATGPRLALDAVTQLGTEAVALTGATTEIRLVKNVEAPPNVALERRTVTIRIEVKPIECGAPGSPCTVFLAYVAPNFQNPPTGLFVQGSYSVPVRLTGPFTVLDNLDPRTIGAIVNLATPAGAGTYPVTVTLPAPLMNAGVRAEPPDPLAVTLGPNP